MRRSGSSVNAQASSSVAGRARLSPVSATISSAHPRHPHNDIFHRGIGQGTYQVLKNAFIQLPLGRPALPQLVVVVLEARPAFSRTIAE